MKKLNRLKKKIILMMKKINLVKKKIKKVRHMLTLMVLLTYIKKFMAMEVLLNIKIKVI